MFQFAKQKFYPLFKEVKACAWWPQQENQLHIYKQKAKNIIVEKGMRLLQGSIAFFASASCSALF